MKYFLISLFLFFLIFSRLYNLTWGAPFFFHPDERNIASSISAFSFPLQMNPHFFAYGSIPLYTIYFLGVVTNTISHATPVFTVSFDHAIIIGRLLSALFSILLIYLLYKTGILLFSKFAGVLAAILGITSIGLIQYAHFATFEMWLTFFSFLLTYICLLFIKQQKKILLLYIGLILGIVIGIKISSTVLFFPVCISLFLCSKKPHEKNLLFILKSLLQCCLIILLSIMVYVISNPFILLDTDSFLGSMQYESSVGLGALPVFYTQGFIKTIPIIYQFIHVFPFIITPFFALIFIPCFIYACYLGWKMKNKLLISFIIFFSTLFLSQTLLFVKWTRYVIPTLPYIYLILGYIFSLIMEFSHRKNFHNIFFKITIYFLLCLSFVYAIIFIYEVYQKEDTRLKALIFAKKNIPQNALIASEVYDLGIVPFNPFFSHITLLNFYDLETNPATIDIINKQLSQSVYIILPSQRIIKNRLISPSLFPIGNTIYKQFLNTRKYQKIYETPCDMLCKLIYTVDPVFNLEETTTVFDRPTIYIFKKI